MAEKEEEYKSKWEKPEKYEKEKRVETVKEIIASSFEEGYFTVEECGDIARAIMEPLVEKFEKEQLEKIYAISIDTDKISDEEIRQTVETKINIKKTEICKTRDVLDTYFKSMDSLPKDIGSLDKKVLFYAQIGKTKIEMKKGDYNE